MCECTAILLKLQIFFGKKVSAEYIACLMPLVLQEKKPENCEFAVWKIEENDAFFLRGLVLNDAERVYISSIKNPGQKTRWLASRFLLKHLMRTTDFVELLADAHGKPYVNSHHIHVSISHSQAFAAVIISDKNIVGIDVEEPGRNIQLLKHKFLSTEEIDYLEPVNENKQLLILWAAKEVMYKMYAKRKLEFRENMLVRPFSLNTSGTLTGQLEKGEFAMQYKLYYILRKNFVLVFSSAHVT